MILTVDILLWILVGLVIYWLFYWRSSRNKL